MKVCLPRMKHLFTPFAKNIFIRLGLTAPVSAIGAGIHIL